METAMIADTVRKNVLILVAEYRKATGYSLPTISNKFYGNADFLADFKAKKTSISVAKLDRMMAQIRIQWPKNADWPMLRAVLMDIPPPPRRK
jgi:hypothetical protein